MSLMPTQDPNAGSNLGIFGAMMDPQTMQFMNNLLQAKMPMPPKPAGTMPNTPAAAPMGQPSGMQPMSGSSAPAPVSTPTQVPPGVSNPAATPDASMAAAPMSDAVAQPQSIEPGSMPTGTQDATDPLASLSPAARALFDQAQQHFNAGQQAQQQAMQILQNMPQQAPYVHPQVGLAGLLPAALAMLVGNPRQRGNNAASLLGGYGQEVQQQAGMQNQANAMAYQQAMQRAQEQAGLLGQQAQSQNAIGTEGTRAAGGIEQYNTLANSRNQVAQTAANSRVQVAGINNETKQNIANLAQGNVQLRNVLANIPNLSAQERPAIMAQLRQTMPQVFGQLSDDDIASAAQALPKEVLQGAQAQHQLASAGYLGVKAEQLPNLTAAQIGNYNAMATKANADAQQAVANTGLIAKKGDQIVQQTALLEPQFRQRGALYAAQAQLAMDQGQKALAQAQATGQGVTPQVIQAVAQQREAVQGQLSVATAQINAILKRNRGTPPTDQTSSDYGAYQHAVDGQANLTGQLDNISTAMDQYRTQALNKSPGGQAEPWATAPYQNAPKVNTFMGINATDPTERSILGYAQAGLKNGPQTAARVQQIRNGLSQLIQQYRAQRNALPVGMAPLSGQ